MLGSIVIVAGVIVMVGSVWALPGTWKAVFSWSSGSVRKQGMLVCGAGLWMAALEATAFVLDADHRATGGYHGAGVLLGLGVLTLLLGFHALLFGSWKGPNLPTPLRLVYLFAYLGGGILLAIAVASRASLAGENWF